MYVAQLKIKQSSVNNTGTNTLCESAFVLQPPTERVATDNSHPVSDFHFLYSFWQLIYVPAVYPALFFYLLSSIY